jgi:hypothetical protein
MFKKNTLWLAFAVFASVFVVVLNAAAQTSSDKSSGVLSPSASQSDSTTDIKTKLHASDEEWKVIGPKLQRVIAASAAMETRIDGSSSSGFGFFGGGMRGGNDSFSDPGDSGFFGRGGRSMGGFGRGGRGDMMGGRGSGAGLGGTGMGGPPGFGGSSSNAITQKLTELQTMLADPKTTSEQLKEKIAEMRSARQKAKAELEAAQKDLRKLLTLNQEAVLISLGYLD